MKAAAIPMPLLRLASKEKRVHGKLYYKPKVFAPFSFCCAPTATAS